MCVCVCVREPEYIKIFPSFNISISVHNLSYSVYWGSKFSMTVKHYLFSWYCISCWQVRFCKCGSTTTTTTITIIIIPLQFFTSVLPDVFSLEFEWQQVFLSLQDSSQYSGHAVIWIVSTRPPTSKSSRPFNNPLDTVPNAPITIGTIVTFMFHSFFNSLARSRYLSFFSHSFRFILWSAGTGKSTILQILFLLLIIMRSWSSGRD